MKFPYKGKWYYINKTLALQLLSLVNNLSKDWDFVILITGDRKVRVGKSVLAMTVCAFLAWMLQTFKKDRKIMNKAPYSLKNCFFDNKKMMDDAQSIPQYSVVHYDEAREGLAASKAMKQFQQDLIDFFNECGQLNHIFVVVCPDFFELKEDMAVARSEFLINVYRKELKVERLFPSEIHTVFDIPGAIPTTVLQRGHFEFFSRNQKAELYDKFRTTRRKSYNSVRANFIGDFTDQYCEDEAEYKEMKSNSLKRFKERHEKNQKESRGARDRDKFIIFKRKEGKTYPEIVNEIESIFGETITQDAARKVFDRGTSGDIGQEKGTSYNYNPIETNKIVNESV